MYVIWLGYVREITLGAHSCGCVRDIIIGAHRFDDSVLPDCCTVPRPTADGAPMCLGQGHYHLSTHMF